MFHEKNNERRGIKTTKIRRMQSLSETQKTHPTLPRLHSFAERLSPRTKKQP